MLMIILITVFAVIYTFVLVFATIFFNIAFVIFSLIRIQCNVCKLGIIFIYVPTQLD